MVIVKGCFMLSVCVFLGSVGGVTLVGECELFVVLYILSNSLHC